MFDQPFTHFLHKDWAIRHKWEDHVVCNLCVGADNEATSTVLMNNWNSIMPCGSLAHLTNGMSSVCELRSPVSESRSELQINFSSFTNTTKRKGEWLSKVGYWWLFDSFKMMLLNDHFSHLSRRNTKHSPVTAYKLWEFMTWLRFYVSINWIIFGLLVRQSKPLNHITLGCSKFRLLFTIC